MSDKIKRKDIEFQEFKYCINSEGKKIGVINAKQISLFFDCDETEKMRCVKLRNVREKIFQGTYVTMSVWSL